MPLVLDPLHSATLPTEQSTPTTQSTSSSPPRTAAVDPSPRTPPPSTSTTSLTPSATTTPGRTTTGTGSSSPPVPVQLIRSSAPSPSISPQSNPSTPNRKQAGTTSSSSRASGGATTTTVPNRHSSSPVSGPSSSPSHASSSSSSPSSSSPSSGQHNGRRVKLYRLEDDAWKDLGTGNCSVLINDGFDTSSSAATSSSPTRGVEPVDEGAWIVVKKEQGKDGTPAEVILRTRVLPYPPGYFDDDEEDVSSGGKGSEGAEKPDKDEGGYQKQQDTLIVWTDRDANVDMALSFATAAGCSDTWEFIQAARKLSYEHPPTSPSPTPSLSSPQPFPAYHVAPHVVKIPEPSLGNIADVEASIRVMVRTAVGRERTAMLIVQNQIVQKLIHVQEEAEDLESLEDLHALCRVMQTILLLNDTVIFELVLQDNVILGVASILEYDPEFPTMKASYRAHLADPSHFTQVVPIRSPSLLSKIHQTHRLHYLKDVVLARILEDSTFSMLNSAIYFNEVDIVNDVASDHQLLKELFAIFDEDDEGGLTDNKGKQKETEELIGPQLPPDMMPSASVASSAPAPPPSTSAAATTTSGTPPPDRKHDAILFLQQFCTMAKNLQMPLRSAFFRSLADRGLLRVLEVALSRTVTREDPIMRSATIAILMTLVDHDPNNVRGYSLRQQEGGKRPLASFLVDLFQKEDDLGLKAQMGEALRVLVDAGGEGGSLEGPPRMRQEDPEAEKFLQFFYDHCVNQLLAPITELPNRSSTDPPLELSITDIALCAHLCDLLCFFVSHHSFRSKYFVLSTSIATHVAKLLSTRHKHLRLAALRFFRACIGRNDDFYNRFLIKHDLFRPLLHVAVEEREKDNLLASACLEFFEHIRTINAKAVINHIVERYGEDVRLLVKANLSTFQMLVHKWEQNNEPPPPPPATIDASKTDPVGPTSRSMKREGSGWSRMEVEAEDSYFNGDSSDDDEPAASSTTSTASATASRKREGDSKTPPDRKRLRLEKTQSEASLPVGGTVGFKTLKRTGLVDYGADDSSDDEGELKKEKLAEGGFVREEVKPTTTNDEGGGSTIGGESIATKPDADDSVLEPGAATPPYSPPPPPSHKSPEPEPDFPLASLKRKKTDEEEEEDGEMGLLSKGKKLASNVAGKLGSLGKGGNGGKGNPTTATSGTGGGMIKISFSKGFGKS